MKLKGLHFDTNEMIEAESQALLNTLTELDFQDVFNNQQKRWERCILTRKETASRVAVAVDPQ
jgi:hypothetical protein